MASRHTFIFALILAPLARPPVAPAAAAIPPSNRIEAQIVGSLTAPADQPMHMPTDIAIDRAGRVYVADGVNDRIVVFRSDGTFERAITRIGDESMKQPVGIGIDPSDRLWIADTGNHRLLILTPSGAPATPIPLPAAEGGKAFDVTDVAVTADGKRTYIVDNENHRLAIRENATGALAFMGKFGEGLGQFRWPFTVAVAPDGYVYVCESIGARVQRVSPTDRWAGQVGRWGIELGQMYRPKGIVIDAGARLYVTDSTTHVVQVFNSRGVVEGVLTDAAGKPLKLAHPMGLAFDSAGRLYVVELAANRVAILTLPARFAPATQPTTRPSGGPAR